ncbi:MAG: tRNA pseudouridine(38-40) synthase TruA, partial [Bacteroidota bacterium]
YFVQIIYHGSNFKGWQKQPGQPTVQGAIEKGLSTLLGKPTTVIGCGRTDTGVHATHYFFHFDSDQELDKYKFTFKLNALVGYDISILDLIEVNDTAHARFNATKRSYTYYMHQSKNPFLKDRSFHYPMMDRLDKNALQATAILIANYQNFFPFCKANTQVNTMECQIFRSEWIFRSNAQWEYKVSANRFLRGMVRLIVGTCINVASNKLELTTVEQALERQTRFEPAWSVPPEGLFLDEVRY